MNISVRAAVVAGWMIGIIGIWPAPSVRAQDYPSKAVIFVVPTAPGGGVDFLARLYAEELGKRWKYKPVVDNRAGAGGLIGAQAVARAPADGHTLLVTPDAVLAQPLFRKAQVDPEKDLTPIALVASTAQVCFSHPESPAKSWGAMLSYAKANPGKLTFVDYPATTNNLYMQRLLRLAGIEGQLVPYNGQTAGIQAVLSNQVNVFCATPSGVPALAKAGKVTLLAVTGHERNPAFPDAPTVKSLGLNFEWNPGFGFLAPGATPKEIIGKLQSDIAEILVLPDVQTRIRGIGFDPETRAPKETAAMLAASTRQFAEMAREFGIKPQD